MSFYLDDYPEEDQAELCPHCSGRDFYPDPVSGALTCSSCFTQSQSQHEEIDIDEGLGLAAMAGKRSKTASFQRGGGGGGGTGGKAARDLSEYDTSRRLPDAESCCLTFQWLLMDASRCVMKLAGISERRTDEYNTAYNHGEDWDRSIFERTVKRIWFAYLHTWTKAARHYSEKYPEMRVSFRDLFLSEPRRSLIIRHLSITIGKRIEEEMILEMQMKLRSGKADSADNNQTDVDSESRGKSRSVSSSKSSNTPPTGNSTKKERKRLLIVSIPKLCSQVFKSQLLRERHRLPNGCYEGLDSYKAVLCIQPSLTLLLSILQLALMHLKTGYAAYHLTSWVANGSLPHALNGYALLPAEMKDRVDMVKKFFIRSAVPPADAVDNLAFLLASSIGWLNNDKHSHEATKDFKDESVVASEYESSHKRKLRDISQPNASLSTVHNVPLLVAHMVQDFGFGQQVIDNALTLMGLHERSTINRDKELAEHTVNVSLVAASPDKLFAPLHVASVVVVACKFCKGWEHWRIHNLHSASRNVKFVPWNDKQFELLGNGPAVDYYVGFLKHTALNGTDCSSNMTQFFRGLNENVASVSEASQEGITSISEKLAVLPNNILSGAPNHNDSSKRSTSNLSSATNLQQYTTSKRHRCEDPHPTCETLPTSYVRLIEYICYIIEETNPSKLHELVTILEEELLSYQNK